MSILTVIKNILGCDFYESEIRQERSTRGCDIKRMHVCFLNSKFFPIGGTSIRTLNFAKTIKDQGHMVYIITWQLSDGYSYSRKALDLLEEGISLHILSLKYKFLRKYVRFLYVLAVGLKYLNFIKQTIKAKNIDIIHCANETIYIGVILKWILKKPVVADLHGMPASKNVFKIKVACRMVDKILTPTDQLRDLLISWGIKPDKINSIRNAIATPKLDVEKSRAKVRAKLGVDEETTLVVFHGVLTNFYNVETLHRLKRISRIISKELEKIRFLIIGHYKRAPVNDEKFIYTGYVENLYEYLSAVDFAIVPIFHNSLGIRSRLLDYFAMSVPVLTTPVGVTGMKFAHGSGGVIIRNSVKELAQSAIELSLSPTRLKEMRECSKKLTKWFSPEKIANELLVVYSQIT